MRERAHRIRGRIWLGLLITLLGVTGGASARPAGRVKTIMYRGYSVTVPASWPVFNLADEPTVCVRFNRHAVYLGVPSGRQRCPGHGAGRSEAILLTPVTASVAAGRPPGAALNLEGRATSFITAAGTVRVAATWSRDRSLIARALHRSSLPRPPRPPTARIAAVRATAASAVYTGLGFDACSAPSPHAMSAWGSSPYRAVGIYIGGVNSACSQPNLNSSWVANEVAAGWHMIPTYVGLQAPSNSCSCAAILPGQASAQGKAAADDAVSQAQGLGLGAGNPIYDDMEAYSRGGANTTAVLNFLSGWTAELHALGYISGVYSSSASGISDLAARYGTGYPEPDDVWIANWNGQQNTADPAVPSSDWPNHQRLHQYRGAHNETYGGVTINIDSDYLDGMTADTGGAGAAQSPPPVLPPSLSVSPTATGITNLVAASNGPGLAQWLVLAGTDPNSLTTISSAPAHGTRTKIAIRSAGPYFAVQAFAGSGQALGSSPVVASPAHVVLFGRGVFVNRGSGTGAVPAGCYIAGGCHLITTLSVGRIRIARTGSESLAQDATGLIFFRLTAQGRRLLRHARSARLPVQVTAIDSSGAAGRANVILIPFSTTGRGPQRGLVAPGPIGPVGLTDFASSTGTGGILSGCYTVAPCRIAATIAVGRTTIAATGPELVGGEELGYVFFSLNARGRALLARAPGNQLAASLVLRSGAGAARARIALVRFT